MGIRFRRSSTVSTLWCYTHCGPILDLLLTWKLPNAIFALCRMAFAPARKPYRIGLLTHENDDFRAIFVTERNCAVPVSKGESQISDRCWYYNGNCLVPRRLSFDENVRAKEGGKETTGLACRLYPSHGPLRLITSHSFRARLCHAKNEAPEEEAGNVCRNKFSGFKYRKMYWL